MKTVAEYMEMAKTTKANYDKTITEAHQNIEQLTADLAKAKKAASQALAAGDKETYTKAAQEAVFIEKRLAVEGKTEVAPYKTAAEHNAFMNECRKAVYYECVPHFQKIVDLLQQLTAEHDEIKKIHARGSQVDSLLHECGIPNGILGAKYHRASLYGDAIISDLIHPLKITGVINHIKSCYIPKQPTEQE